MLGLTAFSRTLSRIAAGFPEFVHHGKFRTNIFEARRVWHWANWVPS